MKVAPIALTVSIPIEAQSPSKKPGFLSNLKKSFKGIFKTKHHPRSRLILLGEDQTTVEAYFLFISI